MTAWIQCRADPRCAVPAPAETGICPCHAKHAAKAGDDPQARPGRPGQAGLVSQAREELEP